MATANRIAAFVAGAGHSGSTLLGLALGAHSQIFYAGEARKSIFLGDTTQPLKKRVCKLCGEGCVIWGDLRPAAHPERDLYELLGERSGKPVVLDSTKKTDWIEAAVTRVRARGGEARLFLLERDGRAVVNSRLRKYPERTAEEHTRDWLEQIELCTSFAARFPGLVLPIRYEELATRPEEQLTRATAFLDLPFEPAMLTPWTSEQHPIGGNTGTQWVMARTGPISGTIGELGERTRSYYEEHPRAFMLDERWRVEMPAGALLAFEIESRGANLAYAWDPQVDA